VCEQSSGQWYDGDATAAQTRLCGEEKSYRGPILADPNSDPDRSEQTPSIAKTAEYTNPCLDNCGEADCE
jgi:hypothetical protein